VCALVRSMELAEAHRDDVSHATKREMRESNLPPDRAKACTEAEPTAMSLAKPDQAEGRSPASCSPGGDGKGRIRTSPGVPDEMQ